MESSGRKDSGLKEREVEATSDETLDQIEATEEVSSSRDAADHPAPSPDGLADDSDGPKDDGPM